MVPLQTRTTGALMETRDHDSLDCQAHAGSRSDCAAMVAAAAKFGRKHQLEVVAALEEVDNNSRRAMLRTAMGAVLGITRHSSQLRVALQALATIPASAAVAADSDVASSRMSYSRFL
eukprot:3376023-Pyramimonas_sp.AAC.1